MPQVLVARAQATIATITDAYTVTLSLGEYLFPATYEGVLPVSVSVVTHVAVTQGEEPVTAFVIGPVCVPAGFASIVIDNDLKTVTFEVAAGTHTLADHGAVAIPVNLAGVTYRPEFVWSKVKAGPAGADADMLDWVKEWNSGRTQIDQSTVITPKLFAGVRNPDGTITGTAMGSYTVRVRNASGMPSTERVEGISGFKEGVRTFCLDNGGNVQLGCGDQRIGYNALTGQIEFGEGVSLRWAGASYIDGDGIFTGALSAATIRALQLDASQITSGKITADHIDVSALEAALLTAGNIEALTLHVTRGSVGGWSLDGESIFRESKADTSGTFTAAAGAMTLGTHGLRGYGWRLESSGAGALAGGNICWDAAGNVLFDPSVSLQWSEPLEALCAALGGAGYPRLTEITSEGIYTGSLSAAQITAGTLAADRIAAGSLTAEKLDAASLRAEIINAAYVSGLDCSFVQGRIGGWKIGEQSLMVGTPGVAGATPLQLRAAAEGSGFWYDGSYRPYGLTMTWCKSANAGHLVFGQVAASGRSVKTDFIGLQMMSWDGQEYFCLAANARLTGAKDIYNRIAGWSFDHERIWKNNVSLAADGSLAHAAKWKLGNDGSGYIAGGNIAWDAAGKVSFSAAASLSWREPLEGIAAALGGEGYPKLTHIAATGIYTGSLTAAQVNVLELDAASIRTGTLSAERIAAGSLDASKLDAASIRARIIDTEYIEGLCCTFSRGTIGGWEVTSSSLAGDHILLDSAHKRIAVYGPEASDRGGPCVQLHYASEEDFGLEARDNDGECVARLGSTNALAGWLLDKTSIRKGNVCLSGDGSITNGALWRLGNDGSGHLAAGNISWDAAGHVIFGESVSLQWQEDMRDALVRGTLYVRGIGLPTYERLLVVNGRTLVQDRQPGLRVVVLRAEDLSVASDTLHATYQDPSEAEALARSLDALTSGCIVVVASYGYVLITEVLDRALQRLGAAGLRYDDPCSFALIGMPGLGRNNGLMAYFDDYYTPAQLSTSVIGGIPQGVNTNSCQRTYIDANGIYTGEVHAAQVRIDSALVVGGRSYEGSISVRDAGDGVMVTLDRAGITAVGGSIGGWNLERGALHAAAPASGHRVYLSASGVIHNDNPETGEDYWALHADGSATFGCGTTFFDQDGAGYLAGGNFSWDRDGNLKCRDATLENIFMTGTSRSPFVAYDGSWWWSDQDMPTEAESHDNLTMPGGDGAILSTNFPWDATQNGRTVTIVNYKYKGAVTWGKMSIEAPAGKYFFEDGLLKKQIILSREYIILKGYGEGSAFYGWIVIHRGDLGTTQKYGFGAKVLYEGWVEGGRLVKYKSFEGGMLTCRQSAAGTYEVSFPSGTSVPVGDYTVMATWSSAAATAGYVFLAQKSTAGFTVKTDSSQAGAFTFQVISMADWITSGPL